MPSNLEELELRVKALEDRSHECREWIGRQDAIAPERRRTQDETNERHFEMIKELQKWKSTMNTRIAFLMGIAAAGGGAIGTVAAKLLGG